MGIAFENSNGIAFTGGETWCPGLEPWESAGGVAGRNASPVEDRDSEIPTSGCQDGERRKEAHRQPPRLVPRVDGSAATNVARPVLVVVRGSIHASEGLSLYIIQAKLAPSAVGELFRLAEQLGAAVVPNIEDAEVVVTAITMRARLERHIPWKLAVQKDVVAPAWLRECAAQRVRLSAQLFPAIRAASTQIPRPLKRKTPPGQPTPPRSVSRSAPLTPTATPPPDTPPPETFPMMPPRELLEKFSPKAGSSVLRLHPLVCPNQRLIEELAVIRNARKLEGEERSELSYSRAIASIKAQPAEFRTIKDIKARLLLVPYLLFPHLSAQDVPFVGAKISNMIEEFIDHGRISDAEELRASERYRSLSALTTVHGIGPTSARELYARGLRSLDALDRFYGVVVPDGYGGWVRNEEELDVQDEDGLESVIREALVLREELNKKQSRRTASARGLDKSLVVLRLAPDRTARRVDLIFAPPEAYWAAVVGWTGSIIFERDLRLAAKDKGLKFNDSGIEVIPAKDERDVFAICGLPWIEPVWRNADFRTAGWLRAVRRE
ncbi:hypothetical protein AURDEDRAFT_124929 [Auricularia subglabra TFB-10046 SS5]|nr:hypothetical protein AURDEDRAFT_124929 [Auricularia subglabra TFB-10046 SS5]